jgi:hypothetical protein
MHISPTVAKTTLILEGLSDVLKLFGALSGLAIRYSMCCGTFTWHCAFFASMLSYCSPS